MADPLSTFMNTPENTENEEVSSTAEVSEAAVTIETMTVNETKEEAKVEVTNDTTSVSTGPSNVTPASSTIADSVAVTSHEIASTSKTVEAAKDLPVPIADVAVSSSIQPEASASILSTSEASSPQKVAAISESLSPQKLTAQQQINTPWRAQWESIGQNLSISHAPTTSTVSTPEVVGSMMSKHVIYTVKTEPMGYIVKRRYNDFVWLREMLCQRYQGLYIPSLPSTSAFTVKKAVSGNSNKYDVNGNYVRNRMIQLNVFMRELSKIPFVQGDTALEAFIWLQDDKEFKSYVDTKTVKSSTPSPGIELWHSMIDANPDDIKAEAIIFNFRKQLEGVKTNLGLLEMQIMQIGKSAMNFTKELETLTAITAAWNATETSFGDSAKTEYPNPYGEIMKTNTSIVSQANQIWLESAQTMPKMFGTICITSIQFHHAQVEGILDHLTLRDTYMRDLLKADKEVATAAELKAKEAFQATKSSFSLFGSKTVDKEDALKKKKDARDAIDLCIKRMTKALVFCEIERFSKIRSDISTKLGGSIIAANMQVNANAINKWQEIGKMAKINPADFEEFVREMLTSQGEQAFIEE